MGCSGSKGGKPPPVPPRRRRLSLGEIGPGEDSSNVAVTEEDRSMLMTLSGKQIMDFVKSDGLADRKYSIGSETDQQGANVNPFASKQVALSGDKFEGKKALGYACKKGLKPEAPNQDSFFILQVEESFSLYGVFDGHGRKGHDISNFVKDNLPKILFSQDKFLEDPLPALEKTFQKTQYLIEKATAMKKIDASRSGTTCSVVLHDHNKKMLYIAHVGDSRVVLGKSMTDADGKQVMLGVDLTIDHKPDLPEERARIEKAGGVVVFDGGWNYRVYAKGKKDARGKMYPGLNMSRAMGDLSGFNDAGISATPDVNKRLVSVQPQSGDAPDGEGGKSKAGATNGRSPERQTSDPNVASTPSIHSHEVDPMNDRFILLCSDGVWEFIGSEQAVKFVSRFPRQEAQTAAEELSAAAWEQWMHEMDGNVVDDITALVIHL